MDLLEIHNDDCFNVFPKIKENSIDLFVLDLPYANKKFGNCTACDWDTPIDLKKMWIEIKRIMKPTAVLCFFCNTKFGFALIESNPKWFRYDLIWKKSRKVGFLSANKKQLRNHENVYVFGDKQGTYNPQKTEGKPYKAFETKNNKKIGEVYGGKSLHNENKGDRHPTSVIENEMVEEHENVYVFGDKQGTYNPQKTEGKPYINNNCNPTSGYYREKGKEYTLTPRNNKGDRHPTSILEFKSVHKTIHRTEKPVGILEYLIKSYSNEGDTVMDFTMGSGSCGEACFNTKRKFIGIEKDDDIFVLAQERLTNLGE